MLIVPVAVSLVVCAVTALESRETLSITAAATVAGLLLYYPVWRRGGASPVHQRGERISRGLDAEEEEAHPGAHPAVHSHTHGAGANGGGGGLGA